MPNPTQNIILPPAASVEDLRQSLEVVLNEMALRATSNKLLAPLDANGNAISGVRDPQNALDAVNLRTLRAAIPAPPTPVRPVRLPLLICTQPTFPVLSPRLANTLIYVADFAHLIFWSGSVASFADGGNGFYTVSAAAPSGVGWHAVDGSSVKYLNADGSLSTKTLPNVTAPAFLEVGGGH